MSASPFAYDVFISHSSKDKSIVHELAERLRADGLRVWFDIWEIRPGDNIPAKIEEGLERSSVLLLCMSTNAFGSDWAVLESQTFRFRDPLNKDRRFIPIRLDEAPIKGTLAQFLYIDWRPERRQVAYESLVAACRRREISARAEANAAAEQLIQKQLQLNRGQAEIVAYAFSPDGALVLTGGSDKSVRLWNLKTGSHIRSLKRQRKGISFMNWSDDQRRALVGLEGGSVRLLDVQSNRVLVDYARSVISPRLMDCFRLLAGGMRATEMSELLALSGTAIRTHLQKLKTKLGVPTRQDVRRLATKVYGPLVRADYPPLRANPSWLLQLAWTLEKSIALSQRYNPHASSDDRPLFRLCAEFYRKNPFEEEYPRRELHSCVWSADKRVALCGGVEGVLRVWNVTDDELLRTFEGHTRPILSVALNSDQRLVLSGGADKTVRLWDLEFGQAVRVLAGHDDEVVQVAWASDGKHAFSADRKGRILNWDFSTIVHERHVAATDTKQTNWLRRTAGAGVPEQIQYTNAKVLLVGDSGVGKSGLSNYLAHGTRVEDDKPLASTDGAWATHWPLGHIQTKAGVEREIWLWDFAGQVDYRLVHQIFMEETAAAVLVFNPQDENPFDGLGRWDRDLQKSARKPFAKLLAAGRIDRGGLLVSASSIEKFMAEREFLPPLHITSAKTGEGCDRLQEAIVGAIKWESVPETTSPLLYQRMKQEILSLRDSGLVLIRMAELKQRMELTLAGQEFEFAELEKVLSLLAGPGMIQRLDFGGFILLRPEVLSRYAAALVRKVRKHPQELGCIREDDLLVGDLDYQDFKRLPSADEAVVLRALSETLISRAWCLRQPWETTALLTFPSYFRRERKEQPSHPSVLVTYRFDGPVDDIYATLVVRLHHTVAFQNKNLWKSAADFETQTGAELGFTLGRETEGASRLDVYFSPEADMNSRVIFLRYVHDHLMQFAKNVVRLRIYSCGNKGCKRFNLPFADRVMIDETLNEDGKGKVFCPGCGKAIALHDLIEDKFHSVAVKEQVRIMQVEGQTVIDNESRELLAVHHTGFIVAEAGQIYRGYTNSDHGIDGEIEFKDDKGRASGMRLYLQLKSGDSYLRKRRSDGAEIFQIKNQRWADYWQRQAYTVMLVIRTSDGEIRWMDVSTYLKDHGSGGKTVKQISFSGERFDAISVQRWRRTLLAAPSP
ncbi:MAG: TIR domain-containing protein [Candidatus Acidiferrales bacterium]